MYIIEDFDCITFKIFFSSRISLKVTQLFYKQKDDIYKSHEYSFLQTSNHHHIPTNDEV